jgi:hypothetical protein
LKAILYHLAQAQPMQHQSFSYSSFLMNFLIYSGLSLLANLVIFESSFETRNFVKFHFSALMPRKPGACCFTTQFLIIPVTRVERVYKPADGKSICLAELESAPYFLSDTVICSPKILRELTKKERKLVRQHGFSYWFYFECKRKEEVSSKLEHCKMYVNDEQLKRLQCEQLSQLKDIILGV